MQLTADDSETIVNRIAVGPASVGAAIYEQEAFERICERGLDCSIEIE